ncbi:hypothetical protein LCER1_G005644 [Lachnellula cervina]|uniref:Peptidase A1 domain-containing protein n=1 Tax=Lachnellula cervina TaxID=1316786 RepID=A0A7D8UTV1_9HELO|nr:hypothetical protein LCER1_G005644 [Lachnellula cervina]
MDLLPRVSAGPQPFSVSSSQHWEGNDERWSTTIIRGQETWVPLPEGCSTSDPPDCSNLRGVQDYQNQPSNGFKTNQSTTWESINFYKLELEDILNYTGNGQYGFETIGLELQNSSGPTLTHQVVAGFVTKDFKFGIFDLGPKPTNFSDFNDPQPSFLWSLHNQSIIPSLSYGYSAGTAYVGEGVGASVVLGGYDALRLDSNNLTIPLGPDDSRSLLMGLQSIQANNTLQGTTSLLSQGIFTFIDSTVPEIWLPIPECKAFETAFGLYLDNSTDRYLVNDTVHSQLLQLNPSITFKLGAEVYGGSSIDIVLPYAAFDLVANYPIYPTATNYFPLWRAANASQYTIGRTFLQESYLVVDYERSDFTVAQAVFPPNATQKIIHILPLEPPKSHQQPTHLHRTKLVSIVLACITFLLALLLFGYFVFKRQKKLKQRESRDGNLKQTITRYWH